MIGCGLITGSGSSCAWAGWYSNPRQLGLNRFYPVFDGIEWTNPITHVAISKILILVFDDFHEGVPGVVIWVVRFVRRVPVSNQATARTVHAL